MASTMKIRRRGITLGIVIPRETAERLEIKPIDESLVDTKRKRHPLKELFGSIKFSKPGHQLVIEMRREMEGNVREGLREQTS